MQGRISGRGPKSESPPGGAGDLGSGERPGGPSPSSWTITDLRLMVEIRHDLIWQSLRMTVVYNIHMYWVMQDLEHQQYQLPHHYSL